MEYTGKDWGERTGVKMGHCYLMAHNLVETKHTSILNMGRPEKSDEIQAAPEKGEMRNSGQGVFQSIHSLVDGLTM